MTTKYEGEELEPFFSKQFKKHLGVTIITLAVMILLAKFGMKTQQDTDPVFTSYIPQPDWLFFFPFQITRYLRGWEELIGTLVIPVLIFGGMFLLPFLDQKWTKKQQRAALLTVALGSVLMISVFTFHTGSTSPIWGCTACHKSGFGKTFSEVPTEVSKITTTFDNKWLAIHYQSPQYWWLVDVNSQSVPRW